MALIIDVETTGFPNRVGLPYGVNPHYEKLNMYDSSRMVQISMILCNEKFEQVEFKDFIVKADGFSIENSKFHGISNEISANKGIPFSEIAEEISLYLKQVSHIIAHNANFDLCITKSELYRIGLYSIIDELNKKNILCTMKHTKNIVKARNNYGIKDPSLSELYSFVLKKNIENAHNSKYDVMNLHSIIKTMYDSNKLNFNEKLVYTPQILTNIIEEKSSENIEERSSENIEEKSSENIEEKSSENIEKIIIDFSKLKLTELKKYCKENGIKGYSKMNKTTIIEKLK